MPELDPRLQKLLALSALPAWASVVALVLFIVVPTLETVAKLNDNMTQFAGQLAKEAALNDLKFKAVADEQRVQDRTADALDRRLGKLEDRRWYAPSGRP